MVEDINRKTKENIKIHTGLQREKVEEGLKTQIENGGIFLANEIDKERSLKVVNPMAVHESAKKLRRKKLSIKPTLKDCNPL